MGPREIQGFTLVEVVLVLTVMAIVSITAIPAFMNTGGAQCDSAARKLVSDISYARRLAQNRNGIYGVSFNALAETYSVYLYDPSTSTKTTVTDPLIGMPMLVDFKTIPGLKGIDIQNPNFKGSSETRFNPQGVPQDASGVALTSAGSVVLSAGGKTRTIYVQPNTGEVSYQ